MPWYDNTGVQLEADHEIATYADGLVTSSKVHDNGNSGASKAISFANGQHQKLTLSASAPAITLQGLVSGQYAEMTLLLAQDATGSRLLPTFTPTIDWGTPGAPTLTTTASKVDIVKLTSYDGVTVVGVVVVKGS